MDPAWGGFAVEVEDHTLAHNDFEGRTGGGGVIIWCLRTGRSRAVAGGPRRGHAVFVLMTTGRLRPTARTRRGEKPQWLLIKRTEAEYAAPGSDIAADRPQSVQSGVTLVPALRQLARCRRAVAPGRGLRRLSEPMPRRQHHRGGRPAGDRGEDERGARVVLVLRERRRQGATRPGPGGDSGRQPAE